MHRITGPLPKPGTFEDEEVLRKLRTRLENWDVVKKLRADPDFEEWEAYSNFSAEERAHSLTGGLLAGSRALGIQVSLVTYSLFVSPTLFCFLSFLFFFLSFGWARAILVTT